MTAGNKNKRVLAGIRPTNRLHLGNYLGAVKGMVDLQNSADYETLYMVADLHALTTPYDKGTLVETRRNVIIDYLACGIDPEKSSLFIQSEIPYHSELAFYLSTVITVARMQHLPTFKEKVKQYPENATMALLNYPVLMAADILVYKADAVPVGVDQEPHLEVSREIARKMNTLFGTEFPEPVRFETPGGYVPSLLGEGKMSKSVEGSYINMSDSLDVIKDRLAKVPTDSGSGDSVPSQGPVANLLTIVELFQGKDLRAEYENSYVTTGLRYKDLKESLGEAIYKEIRPIQEKRQEIAANPDYVNDVLSQGRSNALELAREVIEEVKHKMGLC